MVKHVVSNANAQEIFTGYANAIKSKQPKVLSSPIQIGNIYCRTVESVLKGVNVVMSNIANTGIYIFVETTTGATVKAISQDGTFECLGIETDTAGTFKISVPDYGQYLIWATLSGNIGAKWYTVTASDAGAISSFSATLNITAEVGADISVKLGDIVIASFISDGTTESVVVPIAGIYTVEGVLNGITKIKSSTINTSGESKNVSLNFTAVIYGVFWDGGPSTSLTRTDDAADFVDPVPYYSGMTDTPSSPFDTIYPWSEMSVIEDSNAGKVVQIPKFYFQWVLGGENDDEIRGVRITDKPTVGFMVSPAHMDRGDGQGERDVIYVGRYLCASDYKSKTGVIPQNGGTITTYRTNIHNLGSDIWQGDYPLRLTIWILYLVEFADWNSQAKIGGGCSVNETLMNMGYTDSMPYHTGTIASSISATAYGGTQYRNIEGLWDNVTERCDGIRFSNANIYLEINPANFTTESGGIYVGTRPSSSGYLRAFGISSESGYEWFAFPKAVGGDTVTYIPDYYYRDAAGTVMALGGDERRKNQYSGLFYFNVQCTSSQVWSGYGGTRLMKLPNNS